MSDAELRAQLREHESIIERGLTKMSPAERLLLDAYVDTLIDEDERDES